MDELKELRALVEDGRADLISTEKRQYILDLFVKFNMPMPAAVKQAAANSGFNVSLIKTK